MKNLQEALRIIRGSKEFSFEGSVLVIRGYYTGEVLRLDLGELDEDTLDLLQVDEETEDDIEDDYYE